MNNILCNIYPQGSICWVYTTNSTALSHNKHGPACEHASGTKEWYIAGKLHRLYGPAIEWEDGANWWFINNIRYHNELEYWIAVQNYSSTYVG